MKKRFSVKAALNGSLIWALAVISPAALRAADSRPVFIDQGPNWTPTIRADFYTQDQGSRIMPLSWLEALKLPDGSLFLADSLSRYGYLPNSANKNGLPVGFSNATGNDGQFVGMTCAACHTRQISADGNEYRIDGGPAIVDFQAFLTDLDAAVASVLNDDTTFQAFAISVLGPTAPHVAALREDVEAWYLRYHTLITRSLPTQAPWGPGRLDAVGMIFNRLTGLDLGPPPSYLIADNIRLANAPVRYPFLWNAPKQDKTQWPGFADNGSDILGLSRNLGEVYGVFGVFEPKKEWWHVLLGVNYLNNNSANFDGLKKLEDMVKQIGPPKWPWSVNAALAAQGKAIYNRNTDKGGCSDCHGIRQGEVRLGVQTWATTPLQDVGTDTKEYDILGWDAQTGALQGAAIPGFTSPLNDTDLAFNILRTSVLGSILQNTIPVAAPVQVPQPNLAPQFQAPQNLVDLKGAFNLPAVKSPREQIPAEADSAEKTQYVYEARVLEGIWATAPYLHNGSVPTMAELLKPASQRVRQFKVGPAFDKLNVGLAVEQTKFDYLRRTTDCSARNSGDSSCGHEFGTILPEEEKKALIEYLKTL